MMLIISRAKVRVWEFGRDGRLCEDRKEFTAGDAEDAEDRRESTARGARGIRKTHCKGASKRRSRRDLRSLGWRKGERLWMKVRRWVGATERTKSNQMRRRLVPT